MTIVVETAATWITNAAVAALTSVGAISGTAAVTWTVINTVSQIALYVGMEYAIDSVQRPKQRPLGSELTFNIDPAYPREMIIGERLVGGSMVARYSRGSNLYNAHMVIQLADHPCTELSKVYDGGRLVQASALSHGVRTEITAYSNSGGPRLWMTWHDGRAGQTADSDLVTKSAQDPEVVAGKIEGWTSNHRGAGCAYVHIEVQWDSDILTSIPQFTFLVKGAPLYDRRLDSTAGGSGDHRLDDPSTWEYSTNARVALDHYLLGYKVEDDDLAFGIGLSPEEVPYADFEAGADLCDEDVETGTGLTVETIKRYAANGVISAADYFEDVIENFQLQMAARVVDLGGRIGVIGGEEKAVTVSLSEDDLVAGEPLQFADKLPFSDLYGSVTGRFSDPGNLYQPTPLEPIVSAYNALPDGGEAQAADLSLPYEVHPRRAARLTSAWFARESLQPRLIGVFMPAAWTLEPGDWFEFTSTRLQLAAAKFEVIDIVKNEDFTVVITARAIDPAFVAFDNDNDPDLSVPPAVDPVSLLLDAPEFDVAVTTLEAGGVIEPALEVTLTSDETVAREIVYEYGVWDGSDIEGPTLSDSVHVSQVVTKLRKGVLPDTDYVVRAKAKAGRRESPWTDWSAPLTTGATYAVGSASSVPWSGVTGSGKPDDNADVTSANTAAGIASQGALATLNNVSWGSLVTGRPANLAALVGTEGINNAAVPAGANGLVDTSFRWQSTYWGTDAGGLGGSSAFSIETSTLGLRKSVATGTGITVNGTNYIRQLSSAQRAYFPCKPGDKIAARVLIGSQNVSQIELVITFRDAAGTSVGGSTATTLNTGLLDGTGEETTFNELTNLGTAPSGTVCANIQILGRASTSAPVLRMAKPLLARVAADQTVAPLFSPGREHEIGANVTETRTAAAFTGQGGLATLSFVTIGTNLRRADGTTSATEALIVTSLGTASAITGQGSFATLSAINSTLADANNLLRRTTGGLFTGELAADVTSAHTAAAIASQGAFATLNTINSSGLFDAGVITYTALATTAVRLGTNITRSDGSTSLTDALAVTSLGTAAAIASQGALATLGQVNFGVSGRVYRDDGTTRVTDSIAITSLGTSAAFTGQGALATLSTLAYGSGYLTGFGALAALTQVNLGASGQVYRDDGSTRLTDALAVTSLGTAAAITSQGTLATKNTIDSSGLMGSGVVVYTALASTAVRLGTNITRNDGTTSLTDALAVTSLGTAAAIASQGALATLGQVNFGASGRVYRDDGATRVTDALAITSLGTASAITSQGALATLGQVNLGASGRVYRDDGSTHLTDALAVTSLGTAAAFTGQGALATLSTVGAAQITTAAVTPSKIASIDPTNLIIDVLFSDTSYWSLSGGTDTTSTYDTSSETTTTMGLVKTVKTPTGNGTASQSNSRPVFQQAGRYSPVEGGKSYRIASRTYVKSGFTGYLRVSADWYKADGTTAASTASSAIFGTDYRTSAAGSDTLGVIDGQVTAPADAAYVRLSYFINWSTTQNNAQYALMGEPRMHRAASSELIPSAAIDYTKLTTTAVRLGTNIVRNDGSTSVTDALVVTSLGTASAISGQGSLATLSFVQLNSNVRLQNGSTVATDAMLVTASGTAAAISGQGGLATVNFVLFNSTVRLQDGTTVVTDAMVVTSSGTAAAISGQGNFATNNFYVQSTEPSSPQNGWWWADTTDNVLKVRVSGVWEVIADITPAGGIDPDLQTFTKNATITNVTTSGSTAAVLAQIDVNDVGADGYIAILLGDEVSQLGTYLIPASGCDVSDGGTWDGKVQLTEQLQSGGTEYVLAEWDMEVEDLGGFCAINWDAGVAPWPTPLFDQNLSGDVRYRLKLVRVSGSNNVSGNGINGKVYIQRTPG